MRNTMSSSRFCLLVIAVVTSLCGHQARAALTLSPTFLRDISGSQMESVCTVSGGEQFQGWFKGNSKITDSTTTSVHVTSSGSKYTLKFTNVKVSDGGTYECHGDRSNPEVLTVYVASDVSKVDGDQHIIIGRTDTIKLAGVSGFPKPTFEWLKEKTTLQPSTDPRYTLQADGSLTVKNVKKEDQGNYTCRVSQRTYKKDAKIKVYAVEMPKITPFPSPRKYLTEGYTVSFVCKASGIPPPKYKWYFKGSEINTVGNNYIKDGNLTIVELTSSSKGKYTCKAYNEIGKETIGEDTETVEIIDVYEAPKIIFQGARDVILTRGINFNLECVAKGNPSPTVEWKRNGEIDVRQQKSKRKSVISLTNIQVRDGGTYTCEARNNAVDSKGNIIVATLVRNINIKSPPYINTQASPSEVFSYIGKSDPTFVSCTFGGYPPPFVTMTFNGKVMSNASFTANTSIFTDAKKKFGPYICHAKNDYGQKNQTVTLKQVGKPTAVRDLRATATCNSVTLTWKPPSSDGGMPINKYVLTYAKTRTLNIDGRRTSYTVKKLKQNTVHNFVLRATNKGEWGPTTGKEIQTQKFCAPGRPIIYKPSSQALEISSFTLKWRRPEETGGDAEILYKIRYRDMSDPERPGPWNKKETKGLEIDVKDLDAPRMYKFEVRATNQGGESEPAEKYYQIIKKGARGLQSRLVANLTVILFVAILHLL